ncbi:MAG TPA: FixG Ig-like domain-containing protein, partial [Polyangiaceae bacterium]
VRNGFEVHVVNKLGTRQAYELHVDAPERATVTLASPRVELDPLAQTNVVIFVTAPRSEPLGGDLVHVSVARAGAENDAIAQTVRLLGVR